MIWRRHFAPCWLTVLGLATGAVLLVTPGIVPWVEVIFPVWVFVFSEQILVASFRSGEPKLGSAAGRRRV